MISTKGRYALRVLIDLAEQEPESPVPLRDIAKRQGISEKYLQHIAKLLVDRGLIGTVPLGNYRLVDLDKLLALLSDGVPEEENPPKMPVGRKRRNAFAD